jgi:alginate O-acetyltransferase complex protein AlgJ
MMEKINPKTWARGAALVACLGSMVAYAADPAAGIIGKNEWLFYRYELTEAADAQATNQSLDLIQRFGKVLAANGVELAVTMVPIKMRVYAEHLPDDIKVNDYMAGNYERMSRLLQAERINVIDLNSAFLKSPKRTMDPPLFFRLDTHWTPSGAMLAAETIKAGIDANPSLKKVVNSTPEEAFTIKIATRKRASTGRDLVDQLPKPPPTFAPEMLAQVNVQKSQPAKEDLLGNRAPVDLTLVGSSYSIEWTGFADALRYVLQRDILSVGVPADQGSWVGIESYLRDDAFQTKAPKLLIWEMPERDMRAPPDHKFRDARYLSDNTEWLLRASAWVQATCKPSAVTAKLAPVGLAANAARLKGGELVAGASNEGDFIEISFEKPLTQLDYLSARATSAGSKSMVLEASGPGVTTRRFTVNVAGDDAPHALKTPLPSKGNGFTKVKIFPGKTNAFALQGLQVCSQPEDLLK